MRPETQEWVFKAEGDYKTACREMNHGDDSNYDAVCFHAQQCIEKYLKANLTEQGLPFPKLRDLEALLDLNLQNDLEPMRERLQRLTAMAVEVRYPGFISDLDDAREALESASFAREIIRTNLLQM